MATAPSPFPTFPSVTPPPPFCFGAPPYAPYPFPYPNQPPPPSPSYHAAAYHHHHRFQPPPAPGNPWDPHHAAAQPPPPSSPPPRRPPPSSPPPLAASMAAVAPAWPFPSASVPAVQEGAAPSTSSSGRLPDSPGTTSAPAAALIVLCSGPGPERRPSSPSSAPVLAPSATYARRPTPQTIPSAEAEGQAEALVSKNLPRAVLDLKRRLDEHEAQTKRSFVSLQGQLSKLTDMFSSLTNSMVLSSTSSTTTAPTPSSGRTTMAASAPSLFCVAASSPRTSGGSCFGASSSAYAVPQVFDKMLTPSSGFENSSAHPNQIPSSYVQGGSTNLREQNIDGLPQTYGLHNLICRTVVRADGTEHIYYALPGDYPLERATPEPLFSNESVGVFASKPGQQPYKEEHQEGDRLLKCASTALETDHTGACLNVISDVQDFSLELQQQDDEKACICPVLKASDSDVTNSSQLSSEHSMRELRQLWDPGASAVIVIPPKNDSSNYFFSHDKADLWSQSEHQCIVLRVVFEEVMLDKPPAKPPERFRIALFPDISRGDIENIGISVKLPWSIISAQHFQDFSRQMCSTFSTGCILLWNPWYAILFLRQFLWEFSVKQGTQMPWDPGHATVAMTCEHATTGKRIICMEMHCGSTTVQVTEQRLVLEFSLMAAMLRNGSEFRDRQLLYMSHGTSYTSPGCITKRTSTTSSAITACTISFMIDQWEFLHQLGVKKYCNEKNLLSSPNYRQLLELDIIFITFLPP